MWVDDPGFTKRKFKVNRAALSQESADRADFKTPEDNNLTNF